MSNALETGASEVTYLIIIERLTVVEEQKASLCHHNWNSSVLCLLNGNLPELLLHWQR